MKLKKLSLFLTAIAALTALIILGFYAPYLNSETISRDREKLALGSTIKLPDPTTVGSISVEEALAKRRSIRDYSKDPLNLKQVSQLLWAAQGITETRYGLRTSPSAGGTYPLELYVVVAENSVAELKVGVYQYVPKDHSLILRSTADLRGALSVAALGQKWVAEAPINIVIAAIYERTTKVYGDRGVRYVHMEVGHVGENIYLQATALGLGTVTIGAFHDEEVQRILTLPSEQKPLYIMPVGRPR